MQQAAAQLAVQLAVLLAVQLAVRGAGAPGRHARVPASCADSCTTRSADRGAVGLRDHFRPLAPALQGLRKDTGLISALGPKRTLLKALTLEVKSLSLANELNEKFSAPLGKGSGGEVPAAN